MQHNRISNFKGRILTGILAAIFISLYSGCQSMNPDPNNPPATTDPLLMRLSSANYNYNSARQLELNSETVRAFNLITQQFEYVPNDTLQRWNEEKKRWEFVPRELPLPKTTEE